jgi:hypothetical protein
MGIVDDPTRPGVQVGQKAEKTRAGFHQKSDASSNPIDYHQGIALNGTSTMRKMILTAGVLLLFVAVLWFQIGWYTLLVAPAGALFFLMTLTPLLVEDADTLPARPNGNGEALSAGD